MNFNQAITVIRCPLSHSGANVRQAASTVLASLDSSQEDIDTASGLLAFGTEHLRRGCDEADRLERLY